MKKQTITLREYNRRINKYNILIKQGVKPIIKRNWFKFSVGIVCLSIALFPNGLGIIMYPLSFYFLGIGFKQLEEIKRITKNKIRGFKG